MTSKYDGRLPTTFEEASKLLGQKDSKRWLGIGHTSVKRRLDPTERIEVLHYDTVIATFFANGAMRFSTGGYSSWSTNQRLNAMIPEGAVYRTFEGSSQFRLQVGDRMETVSAFHYDLMVHIDGRLEAVKREK